MINVVPKPQKISESNGYYAVTTLVSNKYFHFLEDINCLCCGKNCNLIFVSNLDIPKQGYKICISENIVVEYSSEVGAYYAVCTLRQLVTDKGFPKVRIEDAPALENRGVLLDISRGKVPKLTTLKNIVDFLAQIKINQLQLYIEGKSFYYRSLGEFYTDDTDVLLASEIKELDDYCLAHYIELVPNQNCLGHMQGWLDEDKLKSLGELEENFEIAKGMSHPPTTLFLDNAKALEFLDTQFNDLLPNFVSNKFNICCDEPWELGLGKSRSRVEKEGKGAVYASYIAKIDELAKKYNKRIMMYGDVVKSYKDILVSLPRDAILLEWGYDERNFSDEDMALYATRKFYVVTGTSMWNTVAGKTDNMLNNIKRGASQAVKYGASGLINTDWGDGGTQQMNALCVYPYAVGASYSWNTSEQDEQIKIFISEYLGDKSHKLGQLIHDFGNYYKLEVESVENRTMLFSLIFNHMTDGISIDGNPCDPTCISHFRTNILSREEYDSLYIYFESLQKRLNEISLDSCDKDIKRQIAFSLQYLMHATNLGKLLCDKKTITQKSIVSLLKDAQELYCEYDYLWHEYNKESGFKDSVKRLCTLINKYKAIIS